MAKFTVFFKEKSIHSSLFDSGVVHIGRDETNEIVLDSLAVAPAHAAVVIREQGSVLKQLNDDFPLKVNNEERTECILNNGDKITIGKHSILYSTTESITLAQQQSTLPDPKPVSFSLEIETAASLTGAGLQIMDGQHIGLVIPLKNAITRLGREGSGIAVISKRSEGYFLSPLASNQSLTVNHEPLKDTAVKLNDNDLVVADQIPMKFFME